MRKILVAIAVLGLCMPLMSGGAQEKKGNKSPEEQFKALDTNNDGKLSKDEFVARVKDDAEKKAKAEQRFSRIDKNSDGFVSLEEYKEGTMKKK